MFLSHLNFFISCLVFLLFVSRRKHQTNTETLFVLFSLLFCISSLLWLVVNYYDFPVSWVIDSYGIYCENILLLIPVAALYNIKKSKTNKYKTLALLFITSFVMLIGHWLIGHKEVLLFYKSNPYIAQNIIFQVFLDFIFLLSFIFLIQYNTKKQELELFDGNFKKYFVFSFGIFYLQDIFILVLLYLSANHIIVHKTLFEVNIVLNTFIAFHLVFLAIYTNWLKEFNYLRIAIKTPKNKVLQNKEIHLSIEELRELQPLSWNEVASKYDATYPLIVKSIEQNTLLSKTEKLYAFLDNFDFSNKELSDVLHVSIRTVETNFYRKRTKIKTEN